MNWDQIQGRWKEFKGKARSRWGRLTNDQLDQIAGEREQLVGLIQQAYGKARSEVQKDVDEFHAECERASCTTEKHN